MMKQQPDKLFHDKLASYTRPAPTRAWDAIEAELDKKNRKGILWFRVAAAIVLLGSASYVLWYVYGPVRQPNSQLAGTNQSTTPVIDSARIPAPARTPVPMIAEAPVIQQAPAPTKQQAATPATQPATTPATSYTVASANRKQRDTKTEQPSAVSTHHIPDETTVAIAETKATAPNNESAVPVQDAPVYTHVYTDHNTYASANVSEAKPANREHITLVYSAREADEYLDKKGLAEATSDEEKPSTLKKLLKKAADLKSNQDPLGELRQRKNEILALSFKSEKQRGQNK